MQCEMQSALSRIWSRVAVPISHDDSHYTTGTSTPLFMNVLRQCSFTWQYQPATNYLLNLYTFMLVLHEVYVTNIKIFLLTSVLQCINSLICTKFQVLLCNTGNSIVIYLHIVKWFQVLLCNTGNFTCRRGATRGHASSIPLYPLSRLRT